MLVLGHIVLATLLRCPGTLATKPISITFGDWNNASNAKTKRCGLWSAANSMHVADFVTFFSVLTHITHEESFLYLQEAARCLKAGGRAVLSFLEFRIPCHWETFKMSLRAEPGGPLTQFVDRDGLTAWASHSGLGVESFFDGDKGHFPIPEEVKWENGTVMKSLGNLGQSVAVLRKV